MDSDLESTLISLISQLLLEFRSMISRSDCESDPESKLMPLVIQITFLVRTLDLDALPKPESKLMSLVSQTVSLFNSTDLDSLPKPLSNLISLISQKVSIDSDQKPESDLNFSSLLEETLELKPHPELISLMFLIFSIVISTNTDFKYLSLFDQVEGYFDEGKFRVTHDSSWNLEPRLISLISELISLRDTTDPEWEPRIMSLIIQIITLIKSSDLDAQPKPESKLMSVITQTVSFFNSTDLDYLPKPLSKLISLISQKASLDSDQEPESDLNILSLLEETFDLKPIPELISLISLIFSVISPNTEFYEVEGYFDEGKFRVTHDFESMLISLISELFPLWDSAHPKWEPEITSLIIQIVYLIRSMGLDLQPKPESKLMSLVTQTVSLFNSMDLNSLPKPLSRLISFISQKISIDSDEKSEPELELKLLINETLELKPDHEIISLIRQIMYLRVDIKLKISLCPQAQGYFDAGGKFSMDREEFQRRRRLYLWPCFLGTFDQYRLNVGEDFTHFHCKSCNGEYHKEYEMVPLEVKHSLHRKHSLQLTCNMGHQTRECYCCDEDLLRVFYFCFACDFSLNIACVAKPRVLSIPPSKWHEHPLTLFPRKTSITCDICALATSNSPFYVCSPCDFVAHRSCINLPRVLRISRHLHRICYTPSFDGGDWCCSVCRKKIDNDYGGYSCVSDGCSYAAHSRCATQSNIWDGIDLDGVPEENEEEVAEPFGRISDGVIQHFGHEHDHWRLDKNTCRDYDDDKLCQACITPIYFGNFYSCLECEFVLHETCGHLAWKIYHPIHPHPLTLNKYHAYISNTGKLKSEWTKLEIQALGDRANRCSACYQFLKAASYYECNKGDCYFRLHVQCATISEPLVHTSHGHPLFLTSKPKEKRKCTVCGRGGLNNVNDTFNCIDECDDFALCYRCATLPQKLRYKHDKHILTLSYGEETDTLTNWCESCEGKINLKKGIYICDEYCGVTLHIECLIGKDLYMKPGSVFVYTTNYGTLEEVTVQSNNLHMSRPICSRCKKRFPHKIVFQCSGSTFCSLDCLIR